MFDFYDFFFFGMGCNSHRNALREAQIKKDWAGLNIFYTLLNIVMNILKPNLPDTMDSRSFMMYLICSGHVGITRIKDGKYNPEGDLMNLNISDMNNMTPYGLPLNLGLVDFTGKSYGRFIPYSPTNKENADCVVVYWNRKDVPPIYRILWYAKRLVDLQASISASISNLKGTVVVRCEKEQEKAVKKAWQAAGEGLPVIFTYNGSSDFGSQPELLCNNLTGDILKQLMETYDKTIADFCGEFGVNANMVMNKLSGVSDKELSQNDERNEILLNTVLDSVKEGLKQASELFGEEMTVDLSFERVYNSDESEVQNDDGSLEEE